MRPYVFSLLPCVLTAAAAADVVHLTPSRDNTLYQDTAGLLSGGGSTAIHAGRNAQTANFIRRGLLAFDIAGSVPAGSTITSVSLQLSNDANNVSPQPVGLHRLAADWGEGAAVAGSGGSGAPAGPGDATWLHRAFSTVLWTTPGGDFAPAASGQAIVAGPGLYTWDSTPSLVADVQGFLDQPGSNFGWLIMGTETVVQSAKRFASREEPNAALRPVLTVHYIPAPSAAFPLLLAAAAAARRRR